MFIIVFPLNQLACVCFRLNFSDSPLDSQEIKAVNPKGNQSRIFIGRTDAEAEIPIFWLPDVNIQLNGKELNAEKD